MAPRLADIEPAKLGRVKHHLAVCRAVPPGDLLDQFVDGLGLGKVFVLCVIRRQVVCEAADVELPGGRGLALRSEVGPRRQDEHGQPKGDPDRVDQEHAAEE